MNLIALKNEVTTDPKGLGYAAFLPHSPGWVVNLLNTVTDEKVVKSRFITARTILNECAPIGADILDSLEAAAVNVSACKWAVRFLSQDSGMDVGNPVTQAMIDQLVAGGILPAAHGVALKQMGMLPATRAEVLGFGHITEQHLIDAGV